MRASLHLALVAPEACKAHGGAEFQRFRLVGLRNVDCVLKGGSALVELVLPSSTIPVRRCSSASDKLARDLCQCQTLAQCGQCRRLITRGGPTPGPGTPNHMAMESASEPGPFRYALANAGDSFVDDPCSARAAPCNMPGSKISESRCSAASDSRGFELA